MKGKKILVVDDEEDVREVMQLHLEREGFEVLVAENGQVAVDLIKEADNRGRIGIILCDIRMPEVNGVKCVEHIKNLAPEIPVVVVTGYPDSDLENSLREKGVKDYLVKPVERNALVETVLRAMG